MGHFFPGLGLSICDVLPLPLGPLPERAAKYCVRYMDKHKIAQHYGKKYEKSAAYFTSIGLPEKGADKEYVCIGVKASNYFMPPETLSEKGPGGGGWILMNMELGVKTREGKVWAPDEQGFNRVWGQLSAVQKEIIEASKVDECAF